MAIENTYVMVKPDGVERGLVGDVISRFERKGLTLENLSMLTISEEMAGRHYAEHTEKPLLRRTRRVHHIGTRGSHGVVRRVSRFGVPDPHWGNESRRGSAWDDSWRLRNRHHAQYRARLGLR